ncbi:class I SAM-dependent methyltransferase [Pseudonocardia sp. RS010]|uniref:class I SAM-dependent methyltransferase n=1 Tax=Pseudonocardia sp. RS010 TaxID=3385979 RepID=UPI00399FDEB1
MAHRSAPGCTGQEERTGSSDRVRAIRRRMAVLSEPFRASYLDWFRAMRTAGLADEDVPSIVDAAVAEIETLEAAHRSGRIGQAGLAYGREQIRGLLERVVAQGAVSAASTNRVRHLITDRFQPKLLDGPGRYTQDWFSYHETHWLEHFGQLAGRPGLQAVEIGSYEGRSACWIATHLLSGPGSRLLCVEPFGEYEGQERNFDHNVRVAGCADRIVTVRGLSHQVLPLLPEGAFDFVYVDGSHRNLDVLQDAAMSWRLLRPGGIVVFDDCEHTLFPDSFGMSAGPAVTAFRSLLHGQYDLLFEDWQVALRKRDPCARSPHPGSSC